MHSIEWAAGLFEGEGTMYYNSGQACLELGMTDRDVVERFKEWAGCGYIKLKKRQEPWKDVYVWRTKGRHVFTTLVNEMLPYFGNRRAYKALNILDDLEL